MTEKAYTCVLCGHAFTSEEPPKRCPACLSARGIQEGGAAGGRSGGGHTPGRSGAAAGRSRSGLIVAIAAVVVIGGAIAAYLSFSGETAGPAGGPGAGGPAPGEAPKGGPAVSPAAVSLDEAPDPAAVTPGVKAYAAELVGGKTPEAVAAAVREHVVALAKAGKLKRLDVEETGFGRRPLTADGVVAALKGGVAPPLTAIEAAAFVAGLGAAAGAEAAVVEDRGAPNGKTSLPRKRAYARVGGVVVDPWAAEGRAEVAAEALKPVDATLLRAWFQGLQALSSAEDEDFKAANEYVARGLKLAPEAPALVFLKGQVAVLSGMVQFGIEDLERALTMEEDAIGRFNLGVAYVQAQRFFKAHEALRRAIEIDPQFAPGWLALAQLHLARLSISPETEKEGLLKSAQEAIEKARQIDPDEEGIAVTSAQVLLASDDERGAITLLDDAIRVHPERPQPYVLLGSLLANRGEWAELVSYLKGGFEHNPENQQIRQLLLVAYMAQERPEEAEKLLTQALEKQPAARDLRVELAGLLAQSGRKDDAHRLLEEELERFPASDKAALLLAQLDLDAGKTADAAKRLDAVLESQPGRFEALALRYIAAAQLKDEATQKKLLDRVSTAQPNGRAMLAQLLLEQGLVEEGATVLEAVLRDRPGSPGESIMLYATYVSLGREEDAARVRTAALAAAGDQRAELEAQFEQVTAEARQVHDAAAAAAAARGAAEEPGGEGDGATDEGPAAPEGAPTPGPGIETGLGPGPRPGGMPTIDLDLKLPDAPGEKKRDDALPGGGPKLDLPDLPKMP